LRTSCSSHTRSLKTETEEPSALMEIRSSWVLGFSGARFLGERFLDSLRASHPKNLGVGCERAESLLIDNYAQWNGPMRPGSNQECIEPVV